MNPAPSAGVSPAGEGLVSLPPLHLLERDMFAFALLSLFFVLRFVKETKGIDLEDMDDGFVPGGH